MFQQQTMRPFDSNKLFMATLWDHLIPICLNAKNSILQIYMKTFISQIKEFQWRSPCFESNKWLNALYWLNKQSTFSIGHPLFSNCPLSFCSFFHSAHLFLYPSILFLTCSVCPANHLSSCLLCPSVLLANLSILSTCPFCPLVPSVHYCPPGRSCSTMPWT